MNRKAIHSDQAPAAIGPYVQAIQTERLVFVSGQLGIRPEDGQLEEDVRSQTQRSLMNIQNILEQAGLSRGNIVKTTIFLTNMENFGAVNQVYGEFFESHYPARSCVEVSRLPKGADVEIECIASA